MIEKQTITIDNPEPNKFTKLRRKGLKFIKAFVEAFVSHCVHEK